MKITLNETPYSGNGLKEDFIYVMFMKNDEIVSEPYIPTIDADNPNTIIVAPTIDASVRGVAYGEDNTAFPDYDSVLIDYYIERSEGAQQIEITADKFGGSFYLEASTLFRTQDGVDMPAEFIIPNCRIQSNFNFTMASTGDPSTFTFTMDAFPDYTRFDHSKKVLAVIQMITAAADTTDLVRTETNSKDIVDSEGIVRKFS